MEDWHILDGADKSAQINMEMDSDLLNKMDPSSRPILHIHRWKMPSCTYGYFFSKDKHLKKTREGMDLARRPTGGGMVFHAFDISFAAILPLNFPGVTHVTLDNYKLINKAVLKAVKTFLEKKGDRSYDSLFSLLESEGKDPSSDARYFCMAKPTIYDVVLSNGQKVAGAAQRRTKKALLHQGTISLSLPSEEVICHMLLQGPSIYKAMKQTTFAIMDEIGLSGVEALSGREALIQLLIKEITTLGKL